MILAFVATTFAMLTAAEPALTGNIQEPFAQESVSQFSPGKGMPTLQELSGMERVVAFEVSKDGRLRATLTAPEGKQMLTVAWKDGAFLLEEAVRAGAGPEVNAQASSGERFVSRDRTVYARVQEGDKKLFEAPGPVLSLAAGTGGALAVGTATGLLLRASATASFEKVFPADSHYSWAPRDVTALAYDATGRLWFGCHEGAGVLDGNAWTLYTGAEGLPYDHFTCAAAGENGAIWFGTERGAIRFDGKQWSYRASLRWLPDNHVNAIVVQNDGTAWIATDKGIARVDRKPMTLAEKAAQFERIIDERHWRLDFAVRCYFTEPGALDTAFRRHTDNDGLYTALYGASQCFRYGATHDPEAKARAQRCFRGLKLLFDATGIPGFPARSVWPVEPGGEDPNAGFGEQANLQMQKSDPLWKNIVPRWPKSADGKYYWKCDTSSDEVCGHYFFYGAYYDLVAETEAEKSEVRTLVAALTDHIVDHGFQLVDHDGKPTRWGRWSPDYINTLQGWADRGIQSLEMLSFLNVAAHVTGNGKYLESAKQLREQHAYHINALWGKAVWPPSAVVPWDGNLAFTSLYGLVKYETDPEVAKYYRLALDNVWLFVSRQNDPFFNTVYTSMMTDTQTPVYDEVVPDTAQARAGALNTLRDTPLLLMSWNMPNSHRLDVSLSPETRGKPGYGWLKNGQAVPVQERSHIRINSDHFDLDAKGDGKTEYEGSFFLLPYYMGLYHGMLR